MLRKAEGEKPFMVLLGNHAKSQRDREGDANSLIWRTEEYKGIAKIIRKYETQYEGVPIMLAGDFNTDVATAPEIAPIRYHVRSAFELSQIPVFSKIITQTYHPPGEPTIFSQLDDIRMNAPLWQSVIEAKVLLYKDKTGNVMHIPETHDQRSEQPSDHFPILIRISTENLF